MTSRAASAPLIGAALAGCGGAGSGASPPPSSGIAGTSKDADGVRRAGRR